MKENKLLLKDSFEPENINFEIIHDFSFRKCVYR